MSSEAPFASSSEAEIKALWLEVQQKVIQLAGGDATKIQPQSIASVLNMLEAVNKSGKQGRDLWYKSAFDKALRCIQTIGGIVAKNVSTVFAPADICYNALTFVIAAWQGYEGMIENLAELLVKCTEFLDRLDYYNEKMDARLTRLACQNLQLFVDICERVIRLRKKHTRFLAFTKQLFLNDDGIQDLLATMDRLNSKESLLVAAQTFKIVSESADDLKIVSASHKEQAKKESAKERRVMIMEALGFRGTDISETGDPHAPWQSAFDVHRGAILETTGAWILNDKTFLDWAAADDPEKTVLVLEGSTGSGKTLMMANILRHLRRQGVNGPTFRNATAYFFPPHDSNEAAPEKRSILEMISRALLWQICTAFDPMVKSTAALAKELTGVETPLDIWQKLFIDNPERLNRDTTFFILIDGMEEDTRAFIPLLQRLVGSTEARKTRVLLTANSISAAEWLHQARGIQYATISLPDRNRPDIEAYINSRLDEMATFRDPTREGIVEWREKIVSSLSMKSHGDYYKLRSSLDALATVDLIEDVEEVLENAGKTRSDQIEAEIRRLNEIRTPKEIQEINDIIIWVSTGRRWFSVQGLEALLAIQRRLLSGKETSLATSLLPFSKKLAEKYTLFSIAERNTVRWRNPETKDMIPLKSKSADSTLPQLTAGLGGRVHETEINIVRHFLHNVCPPEMYERFEFEKFLENKLQVLDKEVISYDPDNARIIVVIVYLSIMTDEETHSSGDLLSHARGELLHDMKLVDLVKAETRFKAQAGILLAQLLTSACGIASMFMPEPDVTYWTWSYGGRQKFIATRAEWLYSMEGVRELLRWFNDPLVVSLVQDVQGKELVRRATAPDANLHKALFYDAAKYLVGQIYSQPSRQWRLWAACYFMRGYILRCDPESSAKMHDEASVYIARETKDIKDLEERHTFDMEMAQRVENWAAEALDQKSNTSSQNSMWEYQAFLVYHSMLPPGSGEQILGRAQKAVEFDVNNPEARLAVASSKSLNHEEAILQLSALKAELEAQQIDSHNQLYAETVIKLGNRIWDLGKDYDQAVEMHKKGLSYGYAHSLYAVVVKRYLEKEKWNYIIEFFSALTETCEMWRRRVDDVIIDLEQLIPSSSTIALAADKTEGWNVLEGFLELAAKFCKEYKYHELVYVCHYFLGRMMGTAGDPSRNKNMILKYEAALDAIRHTSTTEKTLPRWMLYMVITELSGFYSSDPDGSELHGEQIASHRAKIMGLIDVAETTSSSSLNMVGPIGALLAFNAKYGNEQADLADQWMRRIMLESIELLSDDDAANDYEAYAILMQYFQAVDDVENMQISMLMFKWNIHEKLMEAQATEGSPSDRKALKADPTSKEDRSHEVPPKSAEKSNGQDSDVQRVAPENSEPPEQTNDPKRQLTWYSVCNSCRKEGYAEDQPAYACRVCGWAVDMTCLANIESGMEPEIPYSSACVKHNLMYLPKWEPDQIPPAHHIPRLTPAKSADDVDVKIDGWMKLSEWMDQLRALYVR